MCTSDIYIQTCFMRIKNKQSILLSCVVFCVFNQLQLEVTANNNITVGTHSNTSFSTLNNTTASVDLDDANDTSMPTPNTTPTALQDNTYVTANSTNNTSLAVLQNALELTAASTFVLSLQNASAVFEVAILVEGTDSMRLNSSDPEDIDNAILQWYTYCEQYVQDTWRKSGHGNSPLILSFDWVQTNDI